MITEEERARVHNAWRVAANALSIKVEAPYLLKGVDGKEVLCAAYLPDFGDPRGMVVGLLDLVTCKNDKGIKLAAESRGLFFSFINPEVYERYDEQVFKEALADWGFFGSEDQRPDWLPKQNDE
jgi:hypothetical protein